MIGFVIGRFQPLHYGHIGMIKRALAQCTRLYVLIGSANRAPSVKNPWSYELRRQMLIQAFPGEVDKRIFTIPVNDYLYSDYNWIADVVTIFEEVGGKEAVLFGHYKEGNDYLKWFGSCIGFRDIESCAGGVNATDIRRMILDNDPKLPDMYAKYKPGQGLLAIPQSVVDDYQYFQQEQVKFKNYPYPETLQFMCVDTLVVCGGNILVIRRKYPPGAGSLALPGGHVNNNESLVHAAIRELFEETNLRVPEKVVRGSIREMKLFDHPGRSSGIRRITMAFLVHIEPDPDGSMPRVTAADDAGEVMWVPLASAKVGMNFFEDHFDIINTLTS